MTHTETLTRYVANFVDELAASGMEHVVISPGSRSTPLAILCTAHPAIKEWVIVDERSAAYFALGIAKQTKKPVALVCTSGTAAANYMPAVVEAYYGRIPLIVLTADRPHELRDIGAPQTIKQIDIYGDFVKDFQEMALPESAPEMIAYVRNRAARAVRISQQDSPGPVHYNFPFREPLMPQLELPDMWGTRKGSPYNFSYEGKKTLEDRDLKALADLLSKKEKGVIVCGPQTDPDLVDAIIALSEHLQIPIFADPLSQLRAGKNDKANVIAAYDTILRFEQVRKDMQPAYIIRFGAMPISKNYLFYVKEHTSALQFIVEDHATMREPTNHHSEYIFAQGAAFCQDMMTVLPKVERKTAWLKQWQNHNEIVSQAWKTLETDVLTEGNLAYALTEEAAEDTIIFVGNSMPVRDLDTFFTVTNKEIIVHANRGASGIDGVVSSALGLAAVANKKVILYIGDLSFYYDLNSLLIAKQYAIDITVVLINNNGGGIFSFLPQAQDERYFEAVFGTPLHIDFHHAIEMYGGQYQKVTDVASFKQALGSATMHEGLAVIEVQTNRQDNVLWHRQLWEKLAQRLELS